MLSFLATQGFAIMYYGGAGWQFGKRKVSGMSNEEVNKMSPNEFLMKLHGETRTMVPTMAQGMKDMTPLITTTVEQFGSYIREAIKALPQAIGNIFQQSYQGADNPYGNITNVRLSQESQLYQRDRELYAGGALSPYQQDVREAEAKKKRQSDANARKQARLVEEARKREARALFTSQLGQLKPQLGIIEMNRIKQGRKRKAGQSQWQEFYTVNRAIKAAVRTVNSPPNPLRIGWYKESLKKLQQRLINLLSRYDFSGKVPYGVRTYL